MEQILLNERKYVEDCIKYGRIDKKPGRTLALMAQYHYDIGGFRKKKIAEMLIDFMAKYYKPYQNNPRGYDAMCEKIARKTGGRPLIELSGVNVTATEMQTINQIHNKALEQLAFTLLCIAKVEFARNLAKHDWFELNIAQVCNIARITGTNRDKAGLISQLKDRGLIQMPKTGNSNKIRVTFMDDTADIALFVSDFRQLGYIYLKHIGFKFYTCPRCGMINKLAKKDEKPCKYCDKHYPIKTVDITCVDCGLTVAKDARAGRQCRCAACQQVKAREDARRRKQKQRAKNHAKSQERE